MQKTIVDKGLALKVAHTRLEARIHRPQAELCKDQAQLRFAVINIHVLLVEIKQCIDILQND